VECVIARKSIRRVGSPAEREQEAQKQQRQQQEQEQEAAVAVAGEVAQARRMQQGRSMVPGGVDPLGIDPLVEALGPAVKDLPAYKPFLAMVAAGIKDRETVMTEMRMKVGTSSIRQQ
jgi:hypothetical protein